MNPLSRQQLVLGPGRLKNVLYKTCHHRNLDNSSKKSTTAVLFLRALLLESCYQNRYKQYAADQV